MRVERFKGYQRGNIFFIQSMVLLWYELQEEVIEAGTITMYQSHLERHMDIKGL